VSVPRREPTFGALLRQHRLAAGLTQEALAQQSGVSPRAIQLLEADSVHARRGTIVQLAGALSLTGPDREQLERAAAPLPRRRGTAPSGEPRTRRDRHDAPGEARPLPPDDGQGHGLVALPRLAPTNVPWPVSRALGRESDLAALRDLVAVDRQRLVTLTGVGGAGKTRLGVLVAADLLDTFADGVWYVELAPTSTPALVPQVVARVLGAREGPDVPMIDTLVSFLRRKRLLLVLDNCEHLIDACADLAERLLTACPDLHVLATSREPLRLAGERRWQVQPLAVPDRRVGATVDALASAASVRLFVERAQAIQAGFRLTPENADAVAEVCERLEGIPLAIELAASRIAVLSVEQIAARLADGFRVLAAGTRAGPGRQQTMEAALAWSYNLLTPAEQATFRALSTFAGGFDLEAAEAIRGTDGDDESELFDGLGQLVDKSLVVAEQAAHGRRYRLLEPVRQYAHRLLVSLGEEPGARTRHARQYAGLAARAAPLLSGPEQLAWLARLEQERDNLRVALAWTTEHGDVDDGLRLAVALTPYWQAHGYLSEGRRWLDLVLTASRTGDASPAMQMQALLAAGTLAFWHRDLAQAEILLDEALAAARSLDDRRREAEALTWLSSVHRHGDGVERARALSEESIRLSHELGDEATLSFALLYYGMVLGATSEPDRAVHVLEDCLTRFRRLGDVRQVGITAMVLGRTCRLTGDHVRAAACLREAVATLRMVGDLPNLVTALAGLAHAAMSLGDAPHAAVWLSAAQTLRQSLGMRYSPRDHTYELSVREALERQMTASEFDEAYAAGAAMSLEQVVAEVAAAR
jgi:non-specific serine/threonine protein kinase